MNGYDLLKKLGKGGMGTAFMVRRTLDNQIFALKQVVCQNEKEGDNAKAEASTLRSISHPNIVAYVDVFLATEQGLLQVCTVMEFCEKGDLAVFLGKTKERGGRIEEKRAANWMYQLADALCYLHSRQIVHRDIKPSNIFLHEVTPENMALKMGDFGLSASLESGKRSSRVGTPCYLAPEILMTERYDAGVDIWAVGCLSWEILTLDFLWQRRGMMGIVVQTTPVTPEQMPADISRELRSLTFGGIFAKTKNVDPALSHNPSSRPPDSVSSTLGSASVSTSNTWSMSSGSVKNFPAVEEKRGLKWHSDTSMVQVKEIVSLRDLKDGHFLQKWAENGDKRTTGILKAEDRIQEATAGSRQTIKEDEPSNSARSNSMNYISSASTASFSSTTSSTMSIGSSQESAEERKLRKAEEQEQEILRKAKLAQERAKARGYTLDFSGKHSGQFQSNAAIEQAKSRGLEASAQEAALARMDAEKAAAAEAAARKARAREDKKF